MQKTKEISDSDCSNMAGSLLEWFDKHARDLPWRRTRDPYGIWISEVMLQQTQVKTVIPYWTEWMRALPTISDLAAASEDRVLKLWEGLGYYSRARNLHKGAKIIVAQYSGIFPGVFEQVLSLPGIGRYSAGAISSIAFNAPYPILDGNVMRVLTRIRGVKQNPREKATNAYLWSLAGQLVLAASKLEEGNPHFTGKSCSYLNQSLMELGALVCTPRTPECGVCPLMEHCIACKKNLVEKIPNLDRRGAVSKRSYVALIVCNGDQFLARQRPEHGVNGRLWEFPNFEVSDKQSVTPDLIEEHLGLKVRQIRSFMQVRHHITNNSINLSAFGAEFIGKTKGSIVCDCKWLSVDQLGELAFSSAHGKLLKALKKSVMDRS